MSELINTVWDKIQAFGGNVNEQEIIVEYEKTAGGEKVIGGEIYNAHENWDNRNNVRKVLMDFNSHAGNWRLIAEKGEYTTEVTLYSLSTNGDKVEKTRISTRDGVTDVMTPDEW